MPLKHVTETWLAVTLACVTALTGFLMATLPPLPSGIVPWMLLMALAIAYPVFLTPLFRKNRADSVFRWLHWAPAALLGVWLLAALIGVFTGSLAAVRALTWSWSLPAVALVFLSLALFCVQVLRRWFSRLLMLALVLLAFAAGGIVSESGLHPERAVTAFLWNRFVGEDALIAWQGSSSSRSSDVSKQVSSVPLGSTNLSTAKQDEEELIRQRLSSSAAAVAAAKSSDASSKPTVVASKPVHLPKAGGEVEAIMLSLMGLGSARYVRRWQSMKIVKA